ncbi:MAG: hypothetical protein KDB22_21605 [Planctomycetales bacterium]|nr:hypothetical protein [Planctomycetales bacterium]
MGLGGILVLLALLVTLIVFIYLLVLTARGWGVLHTVMLCFLFIECWVFMFLTAGVHYERVRATKAAFAAAKDAKDSMARTEQLLNGDFTANPEEQDGLLPLKGQLRRMTADRGRVWREVTMLQSANDQYLLEMPVAKPADDVAQDAAPAAAAPNSESLPQNLVVYAFAEEKDQDGTALPKYYLGEFLVTSSQAGQVSLAPTRPLLPEQTASIADSDSWTLYELLPLDSHQAFAAVGSRPNDEEIMGHMEQETLEALFEDVPEDRREALVNTYLNDGKRLADNNAPQDSIWVQVQFDENYEIDVDSQDEANATERAYYDASGRSVDSRLQRDPDAGPVVVDPEMSRRLRIVLKEEAARPLVSGEGAIAKEVQRFFVRPLIDYEQAFSNTFIRDRELNGRIARIERETAEIQKAEDNLQSLIVSRQAENQELQFDLDNLHKELAVITQLAEESDSQLTSFRNELSSMYRQVQIMHSQNSAAELSMATVQ